MTTTRACSAAWASLPARVSQTTPRPLLGARPAAPSIPPPLPELLADALVCCLRSRGVCGAADGKYSDAAVAGLTAEFAALRTKFPKSSAVRRLPLNWLSGNVWASSIPSSERHPPTSADGLAAGAVWLCGERRRGFPRGGGCLPAHEPSQRGARAVPRSEALVCRRGQTAGGGGAAGGLS